MELFEALLFMIVTSFYGPSLLSLSSVLDTDNSELLRACGTKMPDKVTSSGNKMTVMFKTDYSQKRKGFKATWKKIPSKIEGGTIKSPNFPSNYPDNVENKVSSIFVDRIRTPYQVPMYIKL